MEIFKTKEELLKLTKEELQEYVSSQDEIIANDFENAFNGLQVVAKLVHDAQNGDFKTSVFNEKK